MAQNFLYMLEFVVDDLLITRPNQCAPEEYPTCCELTFRSHVFVSICDKEFGGCIDTASKSGKCCLFSLESPIKRTDRLHIHVYKKRTDKCKFLIGATDIPVFRIFEDVTNEFYSKNPNWNAHLKDPLAEAKPKKEQKGVIDNDCGAGTSSVRKEELCPTYELNKKLLSLSNMNGVQTGNIVLIMRLACMGPTIVSPFPFGSQNKPPVCPKLRAPCKKDKVNDTMVCKRYFSSNAEKGCACAECEDECDRMAKTPKRCCPEKSEPRGCPCPECDDECEKDMNEDDACSDIVMKPCVLCPTKPECGPERYDEFEANLNGSGLTIRVLKDTHVVEDVYETDCEEEFSKANCATESQRTKGSKNQSNSYKRGNIKYSVNDSCGGDSYNIPLLNKAPSIKTVDGYRKTPSDIRNCCLQAQPDEIDNTLRGINATSKKKGIEVCYQSCEDPDTDVFLVRLGKKKASQNKKNTIEIELRTPKEPPYHCAQKWTKATQIDEEVLDAETKKKKKGRKGKKGKRK